MGTPLLNLIFNLFARLVCFLPPGVFFGGVLIFVHYDRMYYMYDSSLLHGLCFVSVCSFVSGRLAFRLLASIHYQQR